MKRIISSYTEEQINVLKEEAKKRNMSLSELQKYALLLLIPIKEPVVHDISELTEYMFKSLSELTENSCFIISGLFPPDIWTSLSGKEKRKLAMSLYHYVKKNSDSVEKVDVLPGKITMYRKKGTE